MTSLSFSKWFRKSTVRKLLRTWLIQGIGWYALTEVVARFALELGFCIVLWLLGLTPAIILVSWILFHTAAWFLLYGGYMRIWILRVWSTDVSRLSAFLDRVTVKVCSQPFFRVVFLRGSGGRGELSETSDIDICVIPEQGFTAKAAGILFWWGLRAESVFRRFPLEARWIDAERYIPYHVVGETPRVVKAPPSPEGLSVRLAARGLLVALSGMGESGKAVADHLVSTLRQRGFDAVRFCNPHEGRRPLGNWSSSWGFKFESVWKRLGRTQEEWERHPWAKVVYDVLTLLDQIVLAWRLSIIRRPDRIIVSEGSVADVIASLRARGALRATVEGLLLGTSFEPDVPILLEIVPQSVRGPEGDFARLERLAREYMDLKTLLRLIPVDATRPTHQVRFDVERIVEQGLGGAGREPFENSFRSAATESFGA